MILKKQKEEVLNTINANVHSIVYSQLSQLTYNQQVSMQALQQAIQNAISMGVEEGFRTLLENQYTDDDFERDITLKS